MTLSDIVVDGQIIEAVDEFIYLGSKLTSDGRCTPDVLRRIGIASSAMNDLSRVWSQRKLSVRTKLRIYIPPALTYSAIWV